MSVIIVAHHVYGLYRNLHHALCVLMSFTLERDNSTSSKQTQLTYILQKTTVEQKKRMRSTQHKLDYNIKHTCISNQQELQWTPVDET